MTVKTIKCPACHAPVSATATECPFCGSILGSSVPTSAQIQSASQTSGADDGFPVGAFVEALWREDWYLARVLEKDGQGKYKVCYMSEESWDEWFEMENLRPIPYAIGDLVWVIWEDEDEEEIEVQPAILRALGEDGYLVQYINDEDEGEEEWVDAHQLEAVKTDYKVGDTVKVEWEEEWFAAEVKDVREGEFLIAYTDGSAEEWLEPQEFEPLKTDYKVGEKVEVEVEFDGEEDWQTAIIKQIKGDLYLVEYLEDDAGEREWVNVTDIEPFEDE